MPERTAMTPRIKWVCVSDLHLGALNSLLTNVTDDGEHVDGTTPSPVLTALCHCIRSLRRPGQDPPQLVVLGDLFELALTSLEDAAVTFSQFTTALDADTAGGAVAPEVRFVPGNHDHHLWSRASDDRFIHQLAGDASSIPPATDRHATQLLPAHDTVPVRDRFVEILAARGGAPGGMTVVQSYPNLGLVTDDGTRCVLLSHGHFIEPLYRMMSLLDNVFGSPRTGSVEAWQLEADNGGWIDFFWSSMGDSGDVMRVTRALYESMQSTETIHAEIAAIERAIKAAGASRAQADVEAHAAACILRACIGTAIRERHRPGIALSPHAEEGLADYLSGPVAAQVTAEIGSPGETTFVFGHTHKPFVETRTMSAFASPVDVVNTGGWVVDTPEPNPLKGASLILIDEDLNVASLRCYTEGPDSSSYRVRIEAPSSSASNQLVDQLQQDIDPDAEPWTTLAQAVQAMVVDRGHQLADRLRADATALDKLSGARPH
jgi:UDP-2,3-diacylglucosamine pyrophosphatase LpxH